MLILTPELLTYDEKAWSLFEEDKLTPDSKSIHRYQLLRVIRGDKVVEYELDLGPSMLFNAEPFYIPSYLTMSVGQVLDYANQLRDNGTELKQMMADHRGEQNVIKDFIDQVEMTHEYIKRNPVTFAAIKRSKERG